MVVFPNIKINLGLYITEKRPDAFHNILSCFYPVNWCDILEIVPQDSFEFIQTGIPVPGKTEDNLCIKAFDLIKEQYGIPNVRIHLHKIIPMGAGLGGGSSDAAFALKALNGVFNLNIKEEHLEKLAAKLGSDCAFFIRNKPAVATSRGENLEEHSLNLKGKYIVIVCPAIHISTKEAFSGIIPKTYSGDFKTIIEDISIWKNNLHNQFEDTIFPLQTELRRIKGDLYEKGALYASMSGSGSCIYALFDNKPSIDSKEYLSYQGIL